MNTPGSTEFDQRRRSLGAYLGYPVVREYVRLNPMLFSMSCPACGYLTLCETKWGICALCKWQEDGQDDPVANEVWGSNGDLSLAQARLNFSSNLTSLPPSDRRFKTQIACIPHKKRIIASFHELIKAQDPEQFISRLSQIANELRNLMSISLEFTDY
jgi:hypothetical protein